MMLSQHEFKLDYFPPNKTRKFLRYLIFKPRHRQIKYYYSTNNKSPKTPGDNKSRF